MLLINNLLILFACMMFSSHDAIKEVNNPPKVSQVVIESPFDNQPGLEASDLPR